MLRHELVVLSMALSWACRGDAFALAPSLPRVSSLEAEGRTSENQSFRQLPCPRAAAMASFAMATALLALGLSRGRVHRFRVARRFKDDTSEFGPEAPDFAVIELLMQEAVPYQMEKRKRPFEVVDVRPEPDLTTTYDATSSASSQSAKRGWSAAHRLAVKGFPQKLNAELANSRLALLSAFAQGRDVARRAEGAKVTQTVEADEDEEWDEEMGAAPLPTDDGYGWNPDEVEKPEEFDPAKEPGACPPLGYFDPLGFSPKGDKKGWIFRRAAELKHGRVAMMASIGLPFNHYVHMPGWEKAANTFKSQYKVATTFEIAPYLFVFWASILLLELSFWKQDAEKEAGNFGDPFGVGMYTRDMRDKELNNGRFAMFATTGIIAAQYFTNKDAIQQLGL
eukprot:CAMPEP_0197628540 /NCGR_PEP_ID=MMETSP1338-20131121/6807_1 /TAXON_ID=43686 ORGANISM="Pelagodinium beii, Strain RCC1491" /NCGR_SAMPLE_ID=MMETSP1338 /ASSEMBLY_ACC=CAM_ASM_000754 /LENGTH=394 /DNA_ID=CAMNT_0043199523 /DNA_START=40 /DNA_END=1224 /DNA_ORIENTATION=+